MTDQALEVPQPDAAVVAETVSPGSAEPADSVAPVDGDATQPDGDVEASGGDALFAPPALQSVAPSRPAALQQPDAETAAATTAAPESDPEVNVSAEAGPELHTADGVRRHGWLVRCRYTTCGEDYRMLGVC